MKDNFTKVILVVDEDGGKYIIPEFMADEFRSMIAGVRSPDGTWAYDELDRFGLKFGVYKVDAFSEAELYVPNHYLANLGDD